MYFLDALFLSQMTLRLGGIVSKGKGSCFATAPLGRSAEASALVQGCGFCLLWD